MFLDLRNRDSSVFVREKKHRLFLDLRNRDSSLFVGEKKHRLFLDLRNRDSNVFVGEKKHRISYLALWIYRYIFQPRTLRALRPEKQFTVPSVQ